MKSSIIEFLKAFIKEELIIIAISGGPDSTFLVEAIRQVHSKVHLFHLNHGIDEDWSRKSEEFVRLQASRWGLPLTIIKEQVRANSNGFEAEGRRLRYKNLFELAKELSCRFVLTGHNLDDAIETLLYNILRGSSLHGLTSLKERREIVKGSGVYLLRPLLETTKDEIVDYLNENGIEYLIDPSNNDKYFIRNRIRNEILPLIASRINPSYKNAFRRFLKTAWIEEGYIEETLQGVRQRVLPYNNREIILDRVVYKGLHKAIRMRLLQSLLREITNDVYLGDYISLNQMDNFMLEGHSGQMLEIAHRSILLRCTDTLTFILKKDWLDSLAITRTAIESDKTNFPIGCLWIVDNFCKDKKGFFLPNEPFVLCSYKDIMGHGKFFKHLFQRHKIPGWLRHVYPVIVDTTGDVLAVGCVYAKFNEYQEGFRLARFCFNDDWGTILHSLSRLE